MYNKYKKFLYAKRCIVNLKTDKAFRGYMLSENNNIILLKNAELIEPGLEPVSVSGEIVIDKNNIDFIQVIGE
jgi:small nuclear ribonucleoprotein (snRNP)-like protein